MRLALEKKDLDLAAAQKEAQEKTTLADKKLASVGVLEEEVSKLNSSLTESNREATRRDLLLYWSLNLTKLLYTITRIFVAKKSSILLL